VKGIWTWPSEPKEQDKVIRRILGEDELFTILVALAKNPEGLSNAKLDRLLANNSQWRTLSHLRELVALGFVEYHVTFFGEAGSYQLTDLGKAVLPRLQTKQ
jgi:DNA-binding HxlR family transcriptional regulator